MRRAFPTSHCRCRQCVNADGPSGWSLPRVIVRHDRVDALVEVEDAKRAFGRGHAEHDLGTAAGVVRVGDAMGMAEFVQDDAEGEAAL